MEAKKGTERTNCSAKKITKEAGDDGVQSPTTFPPSEGNDGGYLPKGVLSSALNPNAKEWDPQVNRAREEDRCLFITFSNGYPLAEEQITRFFTMKYGQCVEKVYVHRPGPRYANWPPLFGKVVFNGCSIPAIILTEQEQSKFMVDGKPLWCKRFDPTRRRTRRPNRAPRHRQA